MSGIHRAIVDSEWVKAIASALLEFLDFEPAISMGETARHESDCDWYWRLG